MADTQWPRFYVFEQPEEGEAFILAGSVHAPDPEMALLTARDTFARRPKRTAMFVVRDRNISSRTREQLDAAPASEAEPDAGGGRYYLFAKRSHKGVHVQVGEITAPDPETAIRRLDREYGEGRTPVWLAIEEGDIFRSKEADREVLFESSPGKSFRHENEYPVVTMMMELRKKKR